MRRRIRNIKPPGSRNGLKKYQAKSAKIKDPHCQTAPPEPGSGVITGMEED